MSDCEQIRVVVLGEAGVGKTCIIKRFLTNTYSDKYQSTIEDLYHREYIIGNKALQIDILDTAGNNQFPTMRQISIATANAFLLVYDVTSSSSLKSIKQSFEEIKQQRNDFYAIPIVVVGNKLDLAPSIRKVMYEDVRDWIVCRLHKVQVLECSAKTNINIKELFRILIILSKQDSKHTFKRRLSAQPSSRKGLFEEKKEKSAEGECSSGNNKPEESIRPRSMSVLRRASFITTQQLNRAQNAIENCSVS